MEANHLGASASRHRSGSVLENLGAGSEPTPELLEAAALTGFDGVVDGLSQGWNTSSAKEASGFPWVNVSGSHSRVPSSPPVRSLFLTNLQRIWMP